MLFCRGGGVSFVGVLSCVAYGILILELKTADVIFILILELRFVVPRRVESADGIFYLYSRVEGYYDILSLC